MPVVRLARTGSVIGRALDEDGRPVAGAGVVLRLENSTAHKLYQDVTRRQPPLTTDKEGRFLIEVVIPQLGFALGFRQGREVLFREQRMVLHHVKAAETLDLGEFCVRPFKRSP